MGKTMRQIGQENYDALSQRSLKAADFLWISAKDKDGSIFEYGFWLGYENITAPIYESDKGHKVTRNFEGSGSLISIDALPLNIGISVRSVDIILSQINHETEQIVRSLNLKQGRVEVYRGLFDPKTFQMVDGAFLRFIGFIDEVNIKTPAEKSKDPIIEKELLRFCNRVMAFIKNNNEVLRLESTN